MVDCGSAQGHDTLTPIADWPISPEAIDYLFLTHAHIDHCGRVPELIQEGFRGEILTTHPTRALLSPMLRDAMGFGPLSAGEIDHMAQTMDELSWGFEYHETFDLKNGVTFRFGRAGHILGSCFIRFEGKDPAWSIVFSGDLGPKDTPILCDPDLPGPCDLLILESTYGNRFHEDRGQRIQRLGQMLEQALVDGGKVFIPAFSLGRTQELIYEMDRLRSDPQYGREFLALAGGSHIPVFLDSPLGLEITKVYSGLTDYWDKESQDLLAQGDHPIDFDRLYAVRDHKDHNRLMDIPGPCVIIAGSGMCTGGRIVDHLLQGLDDAKNDVFFVGYQAKGTPGRDILRRGERPDGRVYLAGQEMGIRAQVHALTGYSAHADQKGLVEWVEAMEKKPGKIKLVHGEDAAREALARVLGGKGYRVFGGE